jgi:hypothetical protein
LYFCFYSHLRQVRSGQIHPSTYSPPGFSFWENRSPPPRCGDGCALRRSGRLTATPPYPAVFSTTGFTSGKKG